MKKSEKRRRYKRKKTQGFYYGKINQKQHQLSEITGQLETKGK